jgi:hypothetical protein
MGLLTWSCTDEQTTAPVAYPSGDVDTTTPAGDNGQSRVTYIVITPDSFDLEVGKEQKLEAVALDADSNVIEDADFQWASIGETYAIVSGNGTVTARDVGEAMIFCKCDDMVSLMVPVGTYRVVYSNSFESQEDLYGWANVGLLNLKDDPAPGGGQKSLFVSSISACIGLPGPPRDCFLRLQCWGKNAGCCSNSVQIYNSSTMSDIHRTRGRGVGSREWTAVSACKSLANAAGQLYTICLCANAFCFSGGSSAMYIDLLEVREVKGP